MGEKWLQCMAQLLLINSFTKKRKRREVNRVLPAGIRKFLLLFLMNCLFLNRLHDKNLLVFTIMA